MRGNRDDGWVDDPPEEKPKRKRDTTPARRNLTGAPMSYTVGLDRRGEQTLAICCTANLQQ